MNSVRGKPYLVLINGMEVEMLFYKGEEVFDPTIADEYMFQGTLCEVDYSDEVTVIFNVSDDDEGYDDE